jgi:ectoine hydroxylase-related dioxygenase (phytanoyl-CoA dioxygenase family)
MLTAAQLTGHLDAIARDGSTIVENAISPELLDALTEDLERLERIYEIVPSPNVFEGANTLRVYNLLGLSEVWQAVPVHENVLPIIEGVLDPGCLISSLSSIRIQPDETAQPIHADDQLMPLSKPHAPTVCNSMWALTDFTDANGATRIIPGTHLADHSPTYGDEYESIPAEMAKGSVLIWHGSLWHGGGANATTADRIGIAMNYCAGWVRQQENQQLGIPTEIARTFSPRLRELVGYSVYNMLIGHINKHSPVEILDAAPGANPMVWDAV